MAWVCSRPGRATGEMSSARLALGLLFPSGDTACGLCSRGPDTSFLRIPSPFSGGRGVELMIVKILNLTQFHINDKQPVLRGKTTL